MRRVLLTGVVLLVVILILKFLNKYRLHIRKSHFVLYMAIGYNIIFYDCEKLKILYKRRHL